MGRSALMVVLLLICSACGGGGGDGSAGEKDASTSEIPSCSNTWQVGATLPEDYEGCEQGDELVAAATYECTDGSELTTFDDRMYAISGETIKEGTADDPEYQQAFEACTGD